MTDQKTLPSRPEPSPLAVSPREAARLLAISLSHLVALRRRGLFGPQPIRFGRAVRFRVSELREWVAAGCPSAARWAAREVADV